MLAAGSSYATTGHDFRLQKLGQDMTYENTISLTELLMWNSLSSYVVSVESVNCFKNQLDNFWKDQEIIYNFRAEIYGTGNRSEVTV